MLPGVGEWDSVIVVVCPNCFAVCTEDTRQQHCVLACLRHHFGFRLYFDTIDLNLNLNWLFVSKMRRYEYSHRVFTLKDGTIAKSGFIPNLKSRLHYLHFIAILKLFSKQ